VLVYSPADAARETTREAVEKMSRAGADVRVVENAATGHPLLDPLAMIQAAYLEIERLATALGRDPDRPRLLKKVTETL
jgi:glucosamine--fructose-6-phosphate aminotransferase (isomerizing)